MDSEQPTLSSVQAAASTQTIRHLFLLAVLLWCAIPLSPQSADSDFWGHARYGWDTWHRGLARQSTYAYTSVGHTWINHENLSELIMAWGAYAVGPTSLLVIKCVLGVAVLAMGVARAGRSVHPLTMGAICVLVALNLSFYWGLRPHVFTFIFFAALIALVEWCFDGWAGHWNLAWPKRKSDVARPKLRFHRLHALWLAAVLLAVWANTHGGFLAGVAVFVALLSCRAIEVLMVDGVKSWPTALYLVVLAGIGALGTLVNPYGMDLHLWLVDSLSVPRPEIQEWHPPAWLDASSSKLWVMVGLMVWGLTASKRPRDATRLLVLALVGYEALKHQRHLPFVAILFLFWMPGHIQSAIDRVVGEPSNRSPDRSTSRSVVRFAAVGLILLCTLFAYRVGTRFSGVPISNHEYPVDALQFMSDQSLTGRLVVEGHWAQYALGVMGAYGPNDPGIRVAFDGRFRTCYPQQVVDMYFDFFVGDGGPDKRFRSPDSPPADPERILRFEDPQLVLINRHGSHAVGVMNRLEREWTLLYEDQLAQLWGRRSLYDQPGSPDFLPPHERQLAADQPASVRLWPAAPTPRTVTALTQHPAD